LIGSLIEALTNADVAEILQIARTRIVALLRRKGVIADDDESGSGASVVTPERYLRWLGEPTEPPALAPSRGPPFFKSRAIRRRLGEPPQAELFDAH
jgi:hypothetical protein